jgi:hypothetical protein
MNAEAEQQRSVAVIDGPFAAMAGARKNLTKIGARILSHRCNVTFQMTEVAVPRQVIPTHPIGATAKLGEGSSTLCRTVGVFAARATPDVRPARVPWKLRS